jgi:hypothetical protein
MQKIFLFCIFFVSLLRTNAQHALNSCGTTIKDDDISYAFSVGEVSGFSVKPYCTYTQGVIQPRRFLCEPMKYDYNDLFEAFLYPNPAKDVVIIETDYPDFTAYKIIAADGRLVQSGKFTYTSINIQRLPKVPYLLQLLSSDYKIKKSFKIIKN